MPENDYPTLLRLFAHVSDAIIQKVAEFAVRENWGDNLQVLSIYMDYNFEIAREQGLLKFAKDDSYCLWRVGHLVSTDGQPITVLFMKNRLENRQPFVATFVFKGESFEVSLGSASATTVREKAPKAPKYKYPKYRSDYKLQFNFDHYLRDHESRIREILPNLTPYQRFLVLYGAVTTAHRIAAQVAVPQWYRDKNAEAGGYKWLLPLRFNDPDTSLRPDLVAAIDPDETNKEYLVRTLLPPDYAYANARAVISSIDAKISQWI